MATLVGTFLKKISSALFSGAEYDSVDNKTPLKDALNSVYNFDPNQKRDLESLNESEKESILREAMNDAQKSSDKRKHKIFTWRNITFAKDRISFQNKENRITPAQALEIAKSFKTKEEYVNRGVNLFVYDSKGRPKTKGLNADERYNLALLYEATKAEGVKISNYGDMSKLLEKSGEWRHATEDWSKFDQSSVDNETKKSLESLAAMEVKASEPAPATSMTKNETEEPTAPYSKNTLNLVIGQLAAETGIITKQRVKEIAQVQADMIAVSLALQENGVVSRGEDGKIEFDNETLKKHKLLNKFGDAPDVFGLAFMPQEKRDSLKQELGVTERHQKIADGYQLSNNGNFNKELGLVASVPGMAILLKAANPTKKLLTPHNIEFNEAKEDIYNDLTAAQNWNRAGDALSAIAQGKVTEQSATKAEQTVTGNVTKFLAGDMKAPAEKQHDILIKYQAAWVGASLHEMRAHEGLDSFNAGFIAKLPEETRGYLSKIFFNMDEALEPQALADQLNDAVTLDALQTLVAEGKHELGALFQSERYQVLPEFNHEAFGETITNAGNDFEVAFSAPAAQPKAESPKEEAKAEVLKKQKTGTSAKFENAASAQNENGEYSLEKLAEYYYLMGKTNEHNDWKIRQLLMGTKPGAEFDMYDQLAEIGIYADADQRTEIDLLETIPDREEFVEAVKQAKAKFQPYFDKVENNPEPEI